jgi:hypothetical protein
MSFQDLMVHFLKCLDKSGAYNPSYSGGRDQEDQGSKPALANSTQDPILKKIHHKKMLSEYLKWKSAFLVNMRP